MSDFTEIPASTFDTDKPVLGSTHLAMYENLLSVVEGADGAPRMQLGFLERIASGDDIKVQRTSNSADLGVYFSAVLFQTGSVRIVATATGAGSVSTTINANGSTIGVASLNGTSLTVNLTLTGPTAIEVVIGSVSGAGVLSTAYLATDGGYVLPFGGNNIEVVNGPT